MAMSLLLPDPILEGMNRGQTLNQFVESWKDVDSDFIRRCDVLVDRVVRFLQKHTPYSVCGVVKGGSIGKSTYLYENSDVDIVFFINELQSVQHLQNNVPTILNTVRSTLESKWPSVAGTLHYQRTTQHGVRFKLSCADINQEQEVDILPAFNVLEDKTPLQVYNDMKFKSVTQRTYYSVCFARQQVDFVKQAPVKLKNLIQLLKYWAKTQVNIGVKAISSYCLEVVVMHRWHLWGRPENFDMDDKFEEIMILIAELPSLCILWEDRYSALSYWPQLPSPVVLDPVNPYNNLAPQPDHHEWVILQAVNVIRRIQRGEIVRRILGLKSTATMIGITGW